MKQNKMYLVYFILIILVVVTIVSSSLDSAETIALLALYISYKAWVISNIEYQSKYYEEMFKTTLVNKLLEVINVINNGSDKKELLDLIDEYNALQRNAEKKIIFLHFEEKNLHESVLSILTELDEEISKQINLKFLNEEFNTSKIEQLYGDIYRQLFKKNIMFSKFKEL